MLGVLLASFGWAQGKVVGKVSEITGTVSIDLPTGREQIAVGKKVNEGDKIVTGKASTARVDFTDGSTMKIGENSVCEIRKKSVAAGKATKLHLFGGKMRVKVKADKVARGGFEVTTPTAVAGVRGTDFLVDHPFGGKVTKVFVFEGIVLVQSIIDEVAGKATRVRRRHYTSVKPGEMPEEPIELEDEEFEDASNVLAFGAAADEAVEDDGGAAPVEDGEGPEDAGGAAAVPADEVPVDVVGEAAVDITNEELQEIIQETTEEVLTEAVQEVVQEEILETGAASLPAPPGVPSSY